MKVRGIHGQLFDRRRRSFVAIRTRRSIFPHVRTALVLVALTACSSKERDQPPPPPPPPRDAALDAVRAPEVDLTKPCLPASLATANVAYVRTDGPRITACYGNGDDTPGSLTACLVLDETGEILGPRTWEDAGRARLATRELSQPTVDVEVADDVTRPGVASLDGTRAFVFEGDRGDTRWRGRFFDLRTNKQIGSVDLTALDPASKAFTVPFHLREARWVGTRVLVTDRVEVGPEYHAYLVAATGEHVALGDETSSIEVLDDELVAVLTGKTVRLVDVARLIEGGTFTIPGATSPVGDLRIARFADRLVVAYARPAGILFVERGLASVTARELPICK